MNILYVTDLHGDRMKYQQVFHLAVEHRVAAVVNGGDMLPKNADLFGQGEFIAGFLDRHFSRYESAGIYYLGCLGNDDLRVFDALFQTTCSKWRHVVNLAQRRFELGGYEFVGMNWVVDYPFRLKDRCRMDTRNYEFQEQFGTAVLSATSGWLDVPDWEGHARSMPTVEDELEMLIKPPSMDRAVYVVHMPPFGLGLDACADGRRVGSFAVYNFLRKYQPRLALHGHIHESPEISGRWCGDIGRTVCVQPGQGDRLTWVLIDLEKMELARHVEER